VSGALQIDWKHGHQCVNGTFFFFVISASKRRWDGNAKPGAAISRR
jgi:hypothetical protein